MKSYYVRYCTLKWKLILLLALSVVALSGCMTVEKAKDYLIKKKALAAICEEEYPNDTTSRIETDTLVRWDTLMIPEVVSDTTIQFDTVVVTNTNTRYITKTVTNTQTRTVYDTRSLQAKQDTINSQRDTILVLRTSNAILKDQRNSMTKNFIWAILGNMVLLVILFRKPIGRLFSKIQNPLSWLRRS